MLPTNRARSSSTRQPPPASAVVLSKSPLSDPHDAVVESGGHILADYRVRTSLAISLWFLPQRTDRASSVASHNARR
jgi:hypothetical protein